MSTRQQGLIHSGTLIVLFVAAAIVVLFLLPTPRGTPAAIAAAARGTAAANTDTPAAADTNCLGVPADFSTPAVLAAAPPASLWKGWNYAHAITLSATPVAALMDEPLTIRVTDLTPGAPVTLRADLKDYQKQTWQAEATFIADKNGIVDATRDAPRYSSYSGVHAMGLVWSMLPLDVPHPHQTFYAPVGNDFPVHLEALADGHVLAQTTLTRYLWSPDVIHTRLDTDGMVGDLFTPATPGPHPAVLVLGGSEGGLYPQVNEAALFASHGYAALGLAYFQGFGNSDPRLAKLPQALVKIPLEYFVKAAQWLKQQPGVDPRHMAIMGWSKGTEAALITAASFPQEFQAVIGFMPTSVVWAGIQYGPGPLSSSWTLDGRQVPWLDFSLNATMFTSGKPITYLGVYTQALAAAPADSKATVPVQNIRGPLLLITGSDDQIWPSPLMTRQIMQRLAAYHHPYHDEALCYAGAGHAILPPWRPSSARQIAFPGGSFMFGGNQIAYAYADQDAWKQVLAFLKRSLHRHTINHTQRRES